MILRHYDQFHDAVHLVPRKCTTCDGIFAAGGAAVPGALSDATGVTPRRFALEEPLPRETGVPGPVVAC